MESDEDEAVVVLEENASPTPPRYCIHFHKHNTLQIYTNLDRSGELTNSHLEHAPDVPYTSSDNNAVLYHALMCIAW